MKTIIAEKPSVAREIAQIVGATKREAGYLSGNGYHVTWAFGHLVTPALPDGYGIKGLSYPNRVEGYKGENSYVALQPGIVRSVNANFDPRLKHLGNMMAAGVPLVYGIARQPEE